MQHQMYAGRCYMARRGWVPSTRMLDARPETIASCCPRTATYRDRKPSTCRLAGPMSQTTRPHLCRRRLSLESRCLRELWLTTLLSTAGHLWQAGRSWACGASRLCCDPTTGAARVISSYACCEQSSESRTSAATWHSAARGLSQEACAPASGLCSRPEPLELAAAAAGGALPVRCGS